MGVTILIIIAVYYSALHLISYFTGRNATDNDAFFLGNRQSPWILVALGMLGDSISGVTFISVPGMVGKMDMSYMQMVLGFFPGYLIVAFVLLPLYYKLKLTSIYAYLEQRFGTHTYKTGASFFILSRLIGSASKLYLIALLLQVLVFEQWGIPFVFTVSSIILLIWLYTFRSGIKSLVWTDALQTICLLAALFLIVWQVINQLDMNVFEAAGAVVNSPHSQIFVFDWASKQNFFKQFLSGMLIVIVMTGLDQNMMQKNISCKTLKDAQKNMVSYGFGFIPMNYLFLALGVLLLVFATKFNIALPANGDEILPMLANNYLGLSVLICFTIGIVASSFSNADSALTSLTTSFCVDILGTEKMQGSKAKRIRMIVHIVMSMLFISIILFIHRIGQGNVLDTIYTAASYTYGPLLGLYFVGLYSKIKVKDRFVPFVCILAPILTHGLKLSLFYGFDYTVGYEILLFNGVVTALGLCMIIDKRIPNYIH